MRKFIALWSLLIGCCPAFANDKPQEGQQWEFSGKTVETISSSTDLIQGNYSVTLARGKLEITQQGEAVSKAVYDEISRMFGFGQDDRQYLKFPMDVGTKWTATWKHESPGRRRATERSMEYQVKGTEKITVPAGTFDAYKIEGESAYGPVLQKRVIYYSPTCSCIVKFHYDSAVNQQGGKTEIQLLKYTK